MPEQPLDEGLDEEAVERAADEGMLLTDEEGNVPAGEDEPPPAERDD